jgi:hypothetical protein
MFHLFDNFIYAEFNENMLTEYSIGAHRICRGGGWLADPEVIYNLCLSLKTML